jgi:hypothetical protein
MNFKWYLVLLSLTSVVVAAKDSEKKEEFKFKVFKNENECLEYLKKKQKIFVIPESSHFRRIIGIKDADLVEKLRSGDPNARIIAESWHRFNGFSLVHCLTQGRASSLKAIEALDYLFYKGANVNNIDERGFTPLDILIKVMALHSTMIAIFNILMA